MSLRIRLQVAEALGSVNRWYCSQAYGYPVEDPEVLLRYFIMSGGAVDFAVRYDEAMGALNRWYCSEFYCREINNPEVLWHYYVQHGRCPGKKRNNRREAAVAQESELSFA